MHLNNDVRSSSKRGCIGFEPTENKVKVFFLDDNGFGNFNPQNPPLLKMKWFLL